MTVRRRRSHPLSCPRRRWKGPPGTNHRASSGVRRRRLPRDRGRCRHIESPQLPTEAPGAQLGNFGERLWGISVSVVNGALATYVSEHTLAIKGPVREYYLIGRHDTEDEQAWRTEIGWPIFDTVQGSS